MWDRKLINSAYQTQRLNPTHKYSMYDEIYVGHTTVQIFKRFKERSTIQTEDNDSPMFLCNVIALDTGAGWNGKLTIMNCDTKEYFQSDKARELYPDDEGRSKGRTLKF